MEKQYIKSKLKRFVVPVAAVCFPIAWVLADMANNDAIDLLDSCWREFHESVDVRLVRYQWSVKADRYSELQENLRMLEMERYAKDQKSTNDLVRVMTNQQGEPLTAEWHMQIDGKKYKIKVEPKAGMDVNTGERVGPEVLGFMEWLYLDTVFVEYDSLARMKVIKPIDPSSTALPIDLLEIYPGLREWGLLLRNKELLKQLDSRLSKDEKSLTIINQGKGIRETLEVDIIQRTALLVKATTELDGHVIVERIAGHFAPCDARDELWFPNTALTIKRRPDGDTIDVSLCVTRISTGEVFTDKDWEISSPPGTRIDDQTVPHGLE